MFPKKKFYAIKLGNGVKDVVVKNWNECEKLVIGYPAVYKSFRTEKEANRYLNTMTQEQVEKQLLWNDIHKKFRIKEKLEYNLGFRIPDYIVDEILEAKNKKNKKEIYELIDLSIEEKIISKKNGKKLNEYISKNLQL